LHIQKLCHPSFIPAKFTQVFAATALVNFEEKRCILAVAGRRVSELFGSVTFVILVEPV
jgi:hypothetical protein